MAARIFGICANSTNPRRDTHSSWRASFAMRGTWKPGVMRSGWNGPPMPLSALQAELLRLLADHRNPESFVAGGAPLNIKAIRTSKDIDIFHKGSQRLIDTADADAALLTARGFGGVWLQRREAG